MKEGEDEETGGGKEVRGAGVPCVGGATRGCCVRVEGETSAYGGNDTHHMKLITETTKY